MCDYSWTSGDYIADSYLLPDKMLEVRPYRAFLECGSKPLPFHLSLGEFHYLEVISGQIGHLWIKRQHVIFYSGWCLQRPDSVCFLDIMIACKYIIVMDIYSAICIESVRLATLRSIVRISGVIIHPGAKDIRLVNL